MEIFSSGPFVWAMRAAVVAILAAICVSDLRRRRIPNKLVGLGLLLAFAWTALAAPGGGLFDWHAPGSLGFKSAALGAVYAFAGFLVLHLFRMMGAGDVKMMAMVGAFFGKELVVALFFAVFIVGGLVALAWMIKTGSVRTRIQSMWLGALFGMSGAGGPGWRPDRQASSAGSVPYAFAIVGGAALCALATATGLIG